MKAVSEVEFSKSVDALPPAIERLSQVATWAAADISPRAANQQPLTREADDEHNSIFESLVAVEGDIAGLVAYSIYKQNKRAWLQDFLKVSGRHPTDAEARSYIIGESTTRRLAIYRHLADATLAGQGPDAPLEADKTKPATKSFRIKSSGLGFLLSAGVLVAAVALLMFVLHTGLSNPKI